MLRPFVTSLGVLLVAVAATGSRDDGPRVMKVAEGEAVVRITPAPVEPSAAAAPTVVFTLPEAREEDVEAERIRRNANRPAGPRSTVPEVVAEEVFTPRSDADRRPPEDEEGRLRFPNREDWEDFSRRLTLALASGSLERLAALESEALAALTALRAIPGHVEYADWLEDRIADIEVAHLAAELGRTVLPSDPAAVPLYDVWLDWMRDRPPPARSVVLVPQLKPIFVAAQLPPALVWLAETESSFNPAARSPAGARGLFQLMPGTARDLGLRLHPHDERLDPVRSAESAARYLTQLQARFHDWPLVLAAYNAGPGRVSRLLQARSATTFAEIANDLPVETQLYVPRVLATLAIREGLTPSALVFTRSALARD